ncbi:MAG: hypothetical protein IJ890_07670 [Clostridia bacterium]|nr:hypothetical protein [Clostridia bacterium]
MFFAIIWSSKREFMNILKLKAEAEANVAIPFILKRMVELIQIAEQFQGVPCQNETYTESGYAVVVESEIIFPNDSAINAFMDCLSDQTE